MVNRIKSQDEVLLTYREVQMKLKVSRSTVERMVKRKQLKAGKNEGLVRIAKSSVDVYIQRMLSEDKPEES